ncbi:YybH family protein [Jannaschia marina]|uniref:YybH family protein n=1 Tax=Jannaschia marina TaxID=2741674 RepID=UPI0015CB32A8|nr:nuclear transport factor 2 family protein [Jannaschia marina]
MSAANFIKDYEAALGTQDWNEVGPLIGEDARIVFSDGSLFEGKLAIQAAYERNFASIEGESYRMENIRWLAESSDTAAYMFDYYWAGYISGKDASGSGRGTAVLVRAKGKWVLIGEQLGPMNK